MATRPRDTGGPSDLVRVGVPEKHARVGRIKVKPGNDGDGGFEAERTRYVNGNRIAAMGLDRLAAPPCEGQGDVRFTPASKGQRETVAGPQFSFRAEPYDGHPGAAQTSHTGVHPDYRKWEAAVVLNIERHAGPSGRTRRRVGRFGSQGQPRPHQATGTRKDDNDGGKHRGSRQQE